MVHTPTQVDNNIGLKLEITSCSKHKGKIRVLD